MIERRDAGPAFGEISSNVRDGPQVQTGCPVGRALNVAVDLSVDLTTVRKGFHVSQVTKNKIAKDLPRILGA
jgi:hypothetical protein